jgi:hypothetical protein
MLLVGFSRFDWLLIKFGGIFAGDYVVGLYVMQQDLPGNLGLVDNRRLQLPLVVVDAASGFPRITNVDTTFCLFKKKRTLVCVSGAYPHCMLRNGESAARALSLKSVAVVSVFSSMAQEGFVCLPCKFSVLLFGLLDNAKLHFFP